MKRTLVAITAKIIPALLLANPGFPQETADSALQIEMREQQQPGTAEQQWVRQQEQSEHSAGLPSAAGRQQQRNKNTEEAAVQGEEVRHGPYGDKQYEHRQGTPQVSGKHGSPQKKGS